MPTLPFISLRHALLILRIVTPLLFMAHAAVRIANGSIPQFGEFMGAQGFPQPVLLVWAITIAELVAGTMILLNLWTRWATLPLITIAAVGIGIIHRHLGWFVGEHGYLATASFSGCSCSARSSAACASVRAELPAERAREALRWERSRAGR